MDPLALFCTASLLAGGLYWFAFVLGSAEQKGKRAVNISGGSITREKVHDKYEEYSSFFRIPKEIEVAAEVPSHVDTFYNLVTDIYEWGWGQSFHFAPALPGKSHHQSTRAHEEMVADLLKAKPGHRILDVGCGVGGPMRAIASYSGANVVGITINDYQVKRSRTHNKKAGLEKQCEVVCGNFLDMPFEDNSFDGAYAIEATCHAPRLEDVYGEIYRVLKPGSLFVAYEWVTTDLYRSDDPEHVKIIHEIEKGNALPGLRSYKEVSKTAESVGFEVLMDKDLAKPPANPWWSRMKMSRLAYWRNHVIITILSCLRIAPKGVMEVHTMLYETAGYLSQSGDKGIFTPMHSILCRKPAHK